MSQFVADEQLSNMSAEELLNMDLETVQELTEFQALPSGSYRFEVSESEVTTAGKENKPVIKIELSVLECTELKNPEDQEVLDTIEFPRKMKETIWLAAKNGYGIKRFKTFMGHIAQEHGLSNARDVLEAANGMSAEAYVKKTSNTDNDGETRYFNEIDVHTVAWD